MSPRSSCTATTTRSCPSPTRPCCPSRSSKRRRSKSITARRTACVQRSSTRSTRTCWHSSRPDQPPAKHRREERLHGRTDHHTEQFWAEGNSRPHRDRGENARNDRLHPDQPCGFGGGGGIGAAANRSPALWQSPWRHA